jgi:hypothetical protein
VGALSLIALVVFLMVRRLGFDRRFAIIWVVCSSLSPGYAVKFNLYDFWLTDPLAFFFAPAALLCVVLRLDIGFAISLATGSCPRSCSCRTDTGCYPVRERDLLPSDRIEPSPRFRDWFFTALDPQTLSADGVPVASAS